ncbi:beta strand repeat-containing protein [Silvimonas amylolytica]|uniref:Big-1 domain-containing protein n=1 Tax=Silvimonas amylolytica TaxID=449663 RepID=A0ABQ2PNY3_9NEIS|nr:Ig-like domain-containing protein [Silvimonas amylolytica]GGP27335.1 hypothetical protein GCM10010971_31540 [Silvimonas amylolytica]
MNQAKPGQRAWQAVKLLTLPLLASATIVLSACNGGADGSSLFGSGSGGSTTTPTTNPTPTPTPVAVQAASLVVLADKTSLLSGSTDVATLTITALDSNNAVLANTPISVSSASGILSASSVVTDGTGVAKVTYTPGQNRANRTEVISLTNGTVKNSTAILVTGTKVLTTIPTGTSLPIGTPETVNATVTDGKGQLVSGATVNFAVVGAGGSASLSSATATTNSSGIASVTVNGIASGSVTLNTSTLGATASNTLNVSGVNTFAITAPAAQSTLQTNTPLTVTVSSATATTVQFVASIGGFGSGTPTPTTSAAVTAGGSVSVTFKSTTSGVANITAFDSNNPNVSSSVSVAVSAPATQATAVTLQAAPSVLAPSSGSQTSSSVLTIRVTDSGNTGVANVPVALSFTGGPGGGETVSPSYVVTGSSGSSLGVATATFTAGSLPTSQGAPITITATPLINGGGPITPATTSIVIGGTAGSVAIGQASAMSESSDHTAYILPMSVIVADSNGNPMANATVSLSAWPVAFSVSNDFCPNFITPPTGEHDYTLANEDANENLIADSGEVYSVNLLNNITFAPTAGTPPTAVTSPSRNSTIPPNSAAGTLPSTVTTDSSGRASFNYTFLKSSAQWIVSRIRATTTVQGTQATAQTTFRLPVLNADISPTCTLPASPYNSYYSGI